jgi:general secretion pathway protein E
LASALNEIQRLLGGVLEKFDGDTDPFEPAKPIVEKCLVKELKDVDELDASDRHVVAAVDYLLHYALDQRASDIHVEPRRVESLIRFRIDGTLHEIHRAPQGVHRAIVNRIKTLARMDIAERRLPQDGRIKTQREGRDVELRVSSLPVAFGEKVVIRIFDPDHFLRDLGELGMNEADHDLVRGLIAQPYGLILVTGPTGSGKTTSLYAALGALVSPDVNITTIEDPIEMVVEAFNQVQVQPKIDVTFSSALRHVLRQDPDVIMLGEVRDAETAQYAVQAALTGHLVLATVHTNDAPSAPARLLDLGVDAFLIASTLSGVIAQRLVRLVCDRCRSDRPLTADEMAALGLPAGGGPVPIVGHGEGCPTCRGTGRYGRTGVFEILRVTERIRRLIGAREPAAEIARQARLEGMTTLRESALLKLARGQIPVEEVLHATAGVT